VVQVVAAAGADQTEVAGEGGPGGPAQAVEGAFAHGGEGAADEAGPLAGAAAFQAGLGVGAGLAQPADPAAGELVDRARPGQLVQAAEQLGGVVADAGFQPEGGQAIDNDTHLALPG
jgi:hypothetical protein